MHLLPSPADLNTWCESNVGRSFDVVLAGRVFGGRYGESPQRLKHASLEGDVLQLRFNTTETLTISEPRSVAFEENGLLIEDAKYFEFGWHSYGTEEKAENWQTIVYRNEGTHALLEKVSATVAKTESFIPTPKFAVQMVR